MNRLSRRQWLTQAANGFGAVALSALLAEPGRAATNPLAPRTPHFAAQADAVIFLFMDGGPSQMDTFDPKPRLDREHGRPIQAKVQPTQFNNIGTVLRSPWSFQQYGQSGLPVSALFPHLAQHVDQLAIIRSMTTNFSEHTNANYFLHSGHGQQGRPSMGAWATYGLGSVGANLPGFVVLSSGMTPPGGLDVFTNGFLPASYQGSVFLKGQQPLADLVPSERTPTQQQRKLGLLQQLDTAGRAGLGPDGAVDAAIANYELAFRMQTAVPELMNLTGESAATRKLYGLDDAPTALYGMQCLVARRLVERGVRFIELLCPHVGADRWDQHHDLKGGHERNARAVDRPIAGLLTDLQARGLLQRTLVVWAGEFGRTPMAQGSDGRDHNPFGFTIWLAGGGVRGGMAYGATDDYGYHAIENKVHLHDLHATMLHLLGLDHTRLTFRFGGRDMRLTDVHGEVVKAILR
jgi:hypothetical protein